MLYSDIPANMFVTCLYLILDPESGILTIANAGHNLPLLHTCEGSHRSACSRYATRVNARHAV